MTLNQKVTDLYKKVFKTDNEPDSIDLAKLVNIIMQAAQVCPDAEKEVGKDVLDTFRKCCTIKGRSIDVNVTQLQEMMNNQSQAI